MILDILIDPSNQFASNWSFANLKCDDLTLCLSCKLAIIKTTSAEVIIKESVKTMEGALSCHKYEPADSICTNQFVVKTPGRLKSRYYWEAAHSCFRGGAICQDVNSNLIRVQPHVSLGSGEAVIWQSSFEDWLWSLAGVLAKDSHWDNGIFISEHYRADRCQKK